MNQTLQVRNAKRGERSEPSVRRPGAGSPAGSRRPWEKASVPAACLTAAVLLCLLTGCGSGGGPPAGQPVEVITGKPDPVAVEETLAAVGTIEANERVELKPEAPGLIEAVGFVEGQRVQKGQRLFELDSRKETAALAQAEAEASLARSNLERARQLAGTRAISKQEVEQLESQLAVREAIARVEQERLEDRRILAPFDGVMGPRLVSPGQYVAPGLPLATLVDDSQVKVRCRLPERQLASLRPKQTGRVRVNAYPDAVFEGTVDLIDPEVDPATRTVEVRLVTPNVDGRLRPGMFARVELVTGQRDQALVIPESALVATLDAFSVYVVDQGTARQRPVKIGVRLPGKAEILEGLGSGDEIVVSGLQNIVDGSPVKAVAAPVVPLDATAPGAGSPGRS